MSARNKNLVKAFTLVELLVVIMIILLLAGMLLPAINGARKRGRDALCKNNLKQLQVAAMTYATSDGSGALPHAKSTESYDGASATTWHKSNTGWLDWVNYTAHTGNNTAGARRPGETPWWGPYGLTCITNGSLWKYVKSTKAYSCPEWKVESVCGKFDPLGVVLTFNSTNNVPWRCYGMNSSVSGSNIGDIEASKSLLFAEVSNTNWYGAPPVRIATTNLNTSYAATQLTDNNLVPEALGWDGELIITPATANYPKENVGLYHNGKANVVFVDGHIESLAWNVTTNAASGNW